MITLVANDNTTVAISKEMARHSPYIMDAFWDKDELLRSQTLDVTFATGEQLLILKQVLEAKEADGRGSNFIPCKGTLLIGDRPVPAPSFVVIKWMPALDRVMNSLKEDEIIGLFRLADYMCMWELRAGVACLLLHKIITEKCMFEEFFKNSPPSNLTELIYKIYEELK